MDEAHYICTYIRERKKDLYLLFICDLYFSFYFCTKTKNRENENWNFVTAPSLLGFGWNRKLVLYRSHSLPLDDFEYSSAEVRSIHFYFI